MTLSDHIDAVFARRDYKPRIVERTSQNGTRFFAWTATKEGPERHDYAAAAADLRDLLK